MEQAIDPVLVVSDLVKEFGPNRALDGVSFVAQRGEILGILGPNGAGKTTLLHILLGLTTPTSGSIRVLGRDLEQDREEILQRVNFSSAYTALPGNLSVWENLLVFAHLYSVPDPAGAVNQLLASFGCQDLAARMTSQLSSGQLTRVNLCKALLNAPELLLLDEPTASLDPDVADKVRHLLKETREARGLTVLYTSHNMREVEDLCDRVLFVRKGKVIVEGAPAQLLERFRTARMEDVFLSLARDGVLYEESRE